MKGAVACGHPGTARAARLMLEAGGNAFDAALAAMMAACVAEPVFSSLGGGGFLLARKASGETVLYDFFVQTPRRNRAPEALDFLPVLADFGTATQEFHIGWGSIATPGVVKGVFAVHEDLGSLPLRDITAPAIALARDGVRLRDIDAFVFTVVAPILTHSPESRAIFAPQKQELLKSGALLRQPDLAMTLDALTREGEGLFYQGELGRSLVEACRDRGGQLQFEDLAGYRVARRQPFKRRYRNVDIWTNPPPSSGGILIAFALEMLSRQKGADGSFGSPEHLATLAEVMALTNRARLESGFDQMAEASEFFRLLDAELLAAYAEQVRGRPPALRGTTHISVLDSAGNTASLTLSNGEGCGHFLPDSGIMPNNMLGEQDLNVGGFHGWRPGSRMTSMMAPSMARWPDGRMAVLGSGGSNRIRIAILQVLLNLIDFELPVKEAVEAPRIHLEGNQVNIEDGFNEAATQAAEAFAEKSKRWPKNLFFGGVHAVTLDSKGQIKAAGDPRRGGVFDMVPN